MFARLIDFYCVVLLLLLQAFDHKPQLREQSSEGHRVYFANHNSHGDFILLWISLPL